MTREVGRRVPLHERHVQRPEAEAEQGEPDKLLLDKELEQWNAPVQRYLQHHDIHPRLMVGKHEVPAVPVE
jgi:hypothetical protein